MSSPTARSRRGAVVIALAIGLVVAVPAPAAAHDGLVSSSPAADSTVTAALESVSLTFSDELLDIGDANGAFVIQVVGPDELFYNLDCVQRDGATASTAVALGESGTYVVTWQVVSSDAHLTSDSFDFVYNKPTDVTATAGSATAPCRSGDSTPAAEDGEAGEDNEEQAAEARTVTGIWAVGGGLVAFLIVCAVVVAVMGARRRREDQSSHQPPSSAQHSSDQQQPDQQSPDEQSPDERLPE
ncbi:MAG: copper resistance protein CopC [Cryobacterium sp.]|nr:copper resistance protein CopC [Cryobacterium sp.]